MVYSFPAAFILLTGLEMKGSVRLSLISVKSKASPALRKT